MIHGDVSKVFNTYILRQMLAALACNIFCIATGCTFGFSSVLLPQIKEDEQFPYNSTYDSWVASSPCLAMAFGCISAGIISDKYGRRATNLIIAVPFIIGWVVLAFSNNVTLLLLGRVLTGLSTGAYRFLGAVYIGEVASPTNRPPLIFCISLSGTSGILISHILGGYLNWRLISLIVCLPIILGIILQLFIKESPLWLIYKGKIDKGTEIFTWYRGNDAFSQKELAEALEKQKNRPPELTLKENLKAMCCQKFLKPLITAFILFSTLQFNGVNTISFYALDILRGTFLGGEDPFILMLISDGTRVVAISMLFAFSRYISRRKCYLITCTALVIMLVVLIVYIAVEANGSCWLDIMILVLYIGVGSVMIGFSWTFIGEMFPSNLRGLGSGIGSSFSFLLLFISVNIVPGIMINYGIVAIYSIYATVSFIGLLFLYFLLPQTDGKTLQQIENGYEKDKS